MTKISEKREKKQEARGQRQEAVTRDKETSDKRKGARDKRQQTGCRQARLLLEVFLLPPWFKSRPVSSRNVSAPTLLNRNDKKKQLVKETRDQGQRTTNKGQMR